MGAADLMALGECSCYSAHRATLSAGCFCHVPILPGVMSKSLRVAFRCLKEVSRSTC